MDYSVITELQGKTFESIDVEGDEEINFYDANSEDVFEMLSDDVDGLIIDIDGDDLYLFEDPLLVAEKASFTDSEGTWTLVHLKDEAHEATIKWFSKLDVGISIENIA